VDSKRACHPILNSLSLPRIVHAVQMFLANYPQGAPAPRVEPRWRGQPGNRAFVSIWSAST